MGAPQQRRRLGWSVEMTAPDDASDEVRAAIKLFAEEAATNPSPLMSVLVRNSLLGHSPMLISPQRIIAEAELGTKDLERGRMLGILAALFETGADVAMRYDPRTRQVLTDAGIPETTPMDIDRTRGVYIALGLSGMALDAQSPDLPTYAHRFLSAPGQDA